MKTVDGAKIIQHRLTTIYGKFPEGSLSAREVLKTIPTNGVTDNDLAGYIDATITTAIYNYADAYLKSIPKPEKPSFKMSPPSITNNTDDSKQRNQELTDAVLDSLKP